MGRLLLWIGTCVIGLILLGSLVGPRNTSHNPDASSVGYLPPGQCMPAEKYNAAASMVVKNTDWSSITGSATFTAGTKALIGGVTVFREMTRLGTPACADLAPLYDQYRAASRSQMTSVSPIPAKPSSTAGDVDDGGQYPERAICRLGHCTGCKKGRYVQRV